VTHVGVGVSAADRDVTVYETLVQQADTRRQSVSGVSVDEELTMLIAHQNAYKAASKLVTAADEMAQAVLDMVR
jgi:flagellar hook-associated protein 1 FlgK